MAVFSLRRCVLLGGGAIMVSLLLAGCARANLQSKPVTEEDARRRLGEIVSLSMGPSGSTLCAFAGAAQGFCDQWFAAGLANLVPTARPTVTGIRDVDHNADVAGLVLELTGVDAGGSTYHNQFYVVRNALGGLDAPYPIWWMDLKVQSRHR